MKIMRILLLLIVLVVLNVIFADRFLIPTKSISEDQIIYYDENPDQAVNVVLLDSIVFLDPADDVNLPNLRKVGNYKVAVDLQTRSNIGAYNLKSVPNLKAIEMTNGSIELTDMKIIVQYFNINEIDALGFEYGLTKFEDMPAVNVVIFEVQDTPQINQIMAGLSKDPRVADVSFNLVEMTEIPQ